MRQVQQLMGGLSGGLCEAVSWVFIPLMSSESSDYYSPRHFPAPSHAAHLSILGGVRKKWSLWWHSTQLGKLDSHSHSHFPLWEKSWARKISFGTEVGYLVGMGGRWLIQVKGNFLTYFNVSHLRILFYLLFLQWCAETSPLDSWTSTKALVHKWLSKLLFFGWAGK